ncbi:hypothetical protein BDV96DRAFT_596881 [Lophiotrema nucula]|uniref:F-box domain-containing protein n=1 Tax=Lophiotrema nucula TaxID=690887 RepID=A0A6A5ZIY9_9PLEO|nr:hypothetical protein BDV96DRAFT_596881 [Lophiotrema nucula]
MTYELAKHLLATYSASFPFLSRIALFPGPHNLVSNIPFAKLSAAIAMVSSSNPTGAEQSTIEARLERLPAELIDNIAQGFEDEDWVAIRQTCRELHNKTLFGFGKRFFATLKFFLHPFSLSILDHISSLGTFAQHVECVAFGLECAGIIDPLHDQVVAHGTPQHPTAASLGSCKLDIDDLVNARLRADATLIACALSRLPKLEMVFIGREIERDGKWFRRSFGVDKISAFSCPSGICLPGPYSRPLFSVHATITTALSLMQPHHVRLGVSMNEDDRRAFHQMPPGRQRWYSQNQVADQTMHLQLRLHMDDQGFLEEYVSNCCKGLKVENLVVDYISPPYQHRDFRGLRPGLFLQRLPTNHLTQVTLKNGYFDPAEVVQFIRAHLSKITHISFVRCRVDTIGNVHTFSTYSKELGTWYNVVLELQKMPELRYLHLEELKSRPTRHQLHILQRTPYNSFDVEFGSKDAAKTSRRRYLDQQMTLVATWTTPKEIRCGLHWLRTAHRVIEQYHGGKGLKEYSYVTMEKLLNLRYANFRANRGIYGWTDEEAAAIRHQHVQAQKLRLEYDIVDDPRYFPVPPAPYRSRKPFGQTKFPGSAYHTSIPKRYFDTESDTEGEEKSPAVSPYWLPLGAEVLTDTKGEWRTLWLKGKAPAYLFGTQWWKEDGSTDQLAH